MAKQVDVNSARSDGFLKFQSKEAPVDYRVVYRNVRSTPSVAGLAALLDSMKTQAQHLKEAADRLQRI